MPKAKPKVKTQHRGPWQGFKDFLNSGKETVFGKNAEVKNYPNFTPDQMKFLQKFLTQGGNQLQNLKAPNLGNLGQMAQQQFQGLPNLDFKPIEKQALDFFHGQIVPSLADRFSAMSPNSKLNSTAFSQAVGGAGTDLINQLAQLRSQHQFQQYGAMGGLGTQLGQLGLQQYGQQGALGSNLAQMGLQPQYGQVMFPGTQGLFGSVAQPIAQGLGAFGASLLRPF